MATGIRVYVDSSELQKLVTLATALLAPKRINQSISQAGKVLTQKHLVQLDGQRANKLGGDRSHFYAKFAKDTRTEVNDTTANVVIGPADFTGESGGNALWKHYIGGEIAAKAGKALSIPATAEAYGKSPREFNNLRLIIFGAKKVAALVTMKSSNITTGKKGVKSKSSNINQVMYWLVKKVNLRADRTVLPTDMEYGWAAESSLRDLLRRLEQKGATPA